MSGSRASSVGVRGLRDAALSLQSHAETEAFRVSRLGSRLPGLGFRV